MDVTAKKTKVGGASASDHVKAFLLFLLLNSKKNTPTGVTVGPVALPTGPPTHESPDIITILERDSECEPETFATGSALWSAFLLKLNEDGVV